MNSLIYRLLRWDRCLTLAAVLLNTSLLPAQIDIKPPPGIYRTSWVGNTFGGDGGPNGFGYWVQNGADEIEVTPDGTVFAGMEWDEAGRCAGLYKDGRVNRVLLKAPEKGKLADSAWGWGTGNNAVAVSGENLYIASKGKKLLHFTWKPGDLDSARFAAVVEISAVAVGLTARDDRVIVVYPEAIELRHGGDLKLTGRFNVPQARDAVIAPDGSLWVLASNAVRHFGATGKDLGVRVPGLDRPSAVAFDSHKDRLIVCDSGRRQQVLFFDVKDEPKLTATFGEEGGLRSGTPGLAEPKKLFGLRGAGTDAEGNLYVALAFDNGPNGNLVLRSFTPAGKLRWEVMSAAFVDTFGFDPDSDGAVVYSRTAMFDLDLSQKGPGREWRLRGFTLDYPLRPDAHRLRYGCSVLVRNLQGRRLLYTIGQYGGGYRLHTFEGGKGLVAHEVDRISGKDQWAWHVADNGDIWHGDAPEKTIRRYPFKGWKPDGKPDYDWKKPQTWPWPEDFQLIRRIIYQQNTDALYLFGYLKGQKIESWGVVGLTGRRYDGWLAGKETVTWTNRALPTNPKGSDEGKPLTPNCVDIAGDYLFVGMVKPEAGKQYTHIFRTSDGRYIGSLGPGPEVGGLAGWQDMPYAVQALKRKDGEYLVLVEEDWRGKNLLYRWRPDSEANKTLPVGKAEEENAGKTPYPAKVSANRRYLLDQYDKPFFWLGDTAWELFHRLNREEAEHYLKDRAAKKFTVIQAVVLAELGGLDVPNPYGHLPLKDKDPAKPIEDYFQHVDFIVNKADELGLVIGMLPTWGDKWHGSRKERGIFTPQNAAVYGEFLGKRYRDKPIVWILGGDRPVDNERQKAILRAMAAGLKKGDGGRHLMTLHPPGGRDSAQWFHEDDWLSFNMLQTGHGYNHDNYNRVSRCYRRQPAKPCLDGEPSYEDHPAEFNAKNGYTSDYDVRKGAYWALFAGACGHTYGCHDIWQFFADGRDPITAARTPWRKALLPGAGQMRHARALLESRPFLKRIPDQSLLASDAGKGGDHVQATRDEDGSYAFVYSPRGKPFTVDTGKLSGKEIVAHWYDPRSGTATPAGKFPRAGRHQFEPPSQDKDWVLTLDDTAKNYPSPGETRK